ncbi:MAG: hypothetical protein IJZ21_03165, partial [Clostridia bacterium]|nr:hypothetical protein [Clostridia bacterium]
MGIGAVANMPNLDWTNTWCYGDTYPSLAKGAYSSEGKTIYWSGGTDSDLADGDSNQTGADADHAIIIDSAEELAYIASTVQSDNYYFRIADGIDKIVLQPETYGKDIVALNSAEDVKLHFESVINTNKSALTRWVSHNYNQDNQCFSGNFDGNGATIYGMYCTSNDVNSTISGNSAGGLFCNAKAATISNLAIKNSYVNIGTGSANWQFGLMVSYGRGASSSDGSGYLDITVDRCTVADNYVYKPVNSGTLHYGGIVCGNDDYGYFIVKDCLLYGNTAIGYDCTNSKTFDLPVIGGSNLPQTPVFKNSVVLDSALLATYSDNTLYSGSWRALNCCGSSATTRNSFENIYTDWDVDSVTSTVWFDKDAFKSKGGEVVSESDLIGNTAKATEIVDKFNAANNGDTVWYKGNGALLSLNPPTEMLASAQAAYDAITFTTADNYGDNDKTFGVYATSLNLKTNPYISFAFAFSGEYKSNRDQIEVTFDYAGAEEPKVVKVAENGALLSGWSNASNDRFHIYRFQDIPVEALTSPITVTVAYNGTEKVTTGTFSAEGFGLELLNAYKQAPSNYYSTRIEAVKALLFYTQMLQARYGA